jgi:hypothetical protein
MGGRGQGKRLCHVYRAYLLAEMPQALKAPKRTAMGKVIVPQRLTGGEYGQCRRWVMTGNPRNGQMFPGLP